MGSLLPRGGSNELATVKVRSTGPRPSGWPRGRRRRAGATGASRSVTPSTSGTPWNVSRDRSPTVAPTPARRGVLARPRPASGSGSCARSRGRISAAPLARRSALRQAPGRRAAPVPVGLTRQRPLDLGQAPALRLELLDRHELEQVPPAIEAPCVPASRPAGRSAPASCSSGSSAGRARPAPGRWRPVVSLGQRRRDRAASSSIVQSGSPFFMTLLYRANVTLSNTAWPISRIPRRTRQLRSPLSYGQLLPAKPRR